MARKGFVDGDGVLTEVAEAKVGPGGGGVDSRVGFVQR